MYKFQMLDFYFIILFYCVVFWDLIIYFELVIYFISQKETSVAFIFSVSFEATCIFFSFLSFHLIYYL